MSIYIEVDYNQELDDTKKSNESSSSPKKLIGNKLNTQKFHKEYGVVSPSSRTYQELVFITSSDENEEGDPIVSKFQQSELNPIVMENAYYNPEESEKEADKGRENKIVI
ncbi:hypothetical protein C1645_821235 [Glomus cerebriforme]|uniref:Uncharacterized protein n=1 Tax=Glomus cerebriforme TaxID=658196 RepID=A0A397T2N2_9GLOM|nr:hypothetical protein C1645_821235 [Glomus cerebriforme]